MSLFKAASTVSLLTLASRVLGLVRDLLMASMFGANVMTDAFNVAFRIPNLFRRLFAEGAFSQAFVPVLGTHKAHFGDESTHTLISHVATVLFWVLLFTCIAGVVGAPVLVWLLASGLRASPGGMDAAVLMTRWMFPYIGFMSLVALAAGVLNTWRRYAVSALTPVLLNVSMIAAAVLGAPLFARHGIEPIYAMVGGVMLGGVLQLAVQIPALIKLGLMPRIGMSIRTIRVAFADPGVHRILKLMGPALLGVGVAQISLMINTQIASYLQQGSVTWLFYADRLMEFPTALLGVALGVVLTSQLTLAKASGDGERYSSMLDWGLRIVVLLSVPCAIGLLVFAKPLVASLFHYGALSDRDVQQITVALQGYGVGLLGLVAVKVLAPGYYAAQDIRTPVKIAVVVLVITQLLNLLLVPKLAHAGLALSIGLGALVNATWLLVGLIRRGSFKPRPGWGSFIARILMAGVLLTGFLWWGNQHFDWIALRAQPMWRLGLLAAMLIGSMVVYFGALWAARMNLRQVLRR
ncbi:murein biosynthesis integral membrane protein MurJ [Diaphorobacter aerolatus]|uniref:Probable lipid II flippase MurJ n=1 Tax=Diaphorobacter aerolatus TaxID=1288495 RepID=A0A7H0GMS8_9BURK|nr:murein biosynthesis integral membrane protein MurJ [Diaphorobacter aerolatus]QNP49594.1 murein biosynthesis integral membrane protein MurJ [Diaphorobacter aerolatus]